MVQLMPLPLTVSSFSKIQIGFTFLVPAHLGSPGKRAVKRVCVCVCDYHLSGPMKKMVGGQKFTSDMKVQWVVRQWLAQQPTLFFLHQTFRNFLKDGTNAS